MKKQFLMLATLLLTLGVCVNTPLQAMLPWSDTELTQEDKTRVADEIDKYIEAQKKRMQQIGAKLVPSRLKIGRPAIKLKDPAIKLIGRPATQSKPRLGEDPRTWSPTKTKQPEPDVLYAAPTLTRAPEEPVEASSNIRVGLSLPQAQEIPVKVVDVPVEGTTYKTVNLSGMGIKDIGAALSKITNPEQIEALILKNNSITEIPLDAFEKFTNLKVLSLAGNKLNKEAIIDIIVAVTKNKNLNILDITDTVTHKLNLDPMQATMLKMAIRTAAKKHLPEKLQFLLGEPTVADKAVDVLNKLDEFFKKR